MVTVEKIGSLLVGVARCANAYATGAHPVTPDQPSIRPPLRTLHIQHIAYRQMRAWSTDGARPAATRLPSAETRKLDK